MYGYDRTATRRSTRPAARAVAALRWCGFWSAVVLPLCHVSLLVVAGLTPSSTPLLVGLWAANLAGFVLGRRHTPTGDPDAGPGSGSQTGAPTGGDRP
jgi:hypothetical protein